MNWEQLAAVVAVVCAVGGNLLLLGKIIGKMEALQKMTEYRFDTLEAKQDKYNHLQERVVMVEASTKSSHHRQDMLEERLNEHLDQKSV